MRKNRFGSNINKDTVANVIIFILIAYIVYTLYTRNMPSSTPTSSANISTFGENRRDRNKRKHHYNTHRPNDPHGPNDHHGSTVNPKFGRNNLK